MLNRANIEEVEKILGSISRQNAHILFLQHFSDFSEFFINKQTKVVSRETDKLLIYSNTFRV